MKKLQNHVNKIDTYFLDCLQILFLILSEFKQIN